MQCTLVYINGWFGLEVRLFHPVHQRLATPGPGGHQASPGVARRTPGGASQSQAVRQLQAARHPDPAPNVQTVRANRRPQVSQIAPNPVQISTRMACSDQDFAVLQTWASTEVDFALMSW
jgi:hypothetical protein